MFVSSGCFLGHDTTWPQNQAQARKKPFLRSALPTPILRSNSSATVPNRYTTSSPPPTTRVRQNKGPVSDICVRSISNSLSDDSPIVATFVPSPPVVRFSREVDVLDSTPKSPMTSEEDPSVYDSDASQASSTPRRRRRKTGTSRSSTNYLVAISPRNSGSKTTLLQAIRPRLLLQLQELAVNQRARPTIDVFPASLIAGPLATAKYIHHFPRMFGVKGELGPGDLILVKSEDYTADAEEDDEQPSSQRQPVAVFSPGRGQNDVGEITMDDGKVWVCSNSKAHYSFTHVDEEHGSGSSVTVRWVKRNTIKRVSSAPMPPGSPSCPSSPMSESSTDSAGPEYQYTFSIINPEKRRHPILATLTQQSIEIYDEYTRPAPSSNRCPPNSPVVESTRSDELAPSAVPVDESSTQRETLSVDENTKNLIMITGLWLSLRLGPSLDSHTSEASIESVAGSQDTPRCTPSSTFQSLPRRQTTSFGSSNTSCPVAQTTTRLRRAMSTSAGFMARRRRGDTTGTVTSGSGTTILEPMKMTAAATATEIRSDDQVLTTRALAQKATKQARRASWFKRLTH